MKQIAYITMVFLPAHFISVCFRCPLQSLAYWHHQESFLHEYGNFQPTITWIYFRVYDRDICSNHSDHLGCYQCLPKHTPIWREYSILETARVAALRCVLCIPGGYVLDGQSEYGRGYDAWCRGHGGWSPMKIGSTSAGTVQQFHWFPFLNPLPTGLFLMQFLYCAWHVPIQMCAIEIIWPWCKCWYTLLTGRCGPLLHVAKTEATFRIQFLTAWVALPMTGPVTNLL